MILADNKEERVKILNQIEKVQQKDFEEIFKVTKYLPITIRYLDPPLHEFIPKEEEVIEDLAKKTSKSKKTIIEKIEKIEEVNPMMGHRGCRLFISFPEIFVMQTRAIFNAYKEVKEEKMFEPNVEVMIPLVSNINEFEYLKEIFKKEIKEIFKDNKLPAYRLGTMIELPRAVLIANKLAEKADFFSFGTNDLTQMTLGFSRDDASKFLSDYIDKNIIKKDPFKTLDTDGVGELIKIGIKEARKVKDIKIGVCGEHGGDPKSIEYFCENNFDYVSCSPFRVPTARLAVAQEKIKTFKK